MCLIVFAWQIVPGAPLVAAANRDERYARPSASAQWWQDQPEIFAGRDLEAGGTWLGVTKTGRFAAVTNVRNPHDNGDRSCSRGELAARFLSDNVTPQHFVDRLREASDVYCGYNLLVGDRESLVWYSNRGGDDERNGRALAPGLYGVSNALLDSPWPKVVRSKAQFASLLCQGAPDDAYFEMLTDCTPAPEARLPATGVSIEMERLLSPVMVRLPEYGTRVSSLVRLYATGEVSLQERPVEPATAA